MGCAKGATQAIVKVQPFVEFYDEELAWHTPQWA